MGQENTLVVPTLVVTAVLLPPSLWLTWETIRNVLEVSVPSGSPQSGSKLRAATDASLDTIESKSPISPKPQITRNQLSHTQKKSMHWNLYCSALCSISYSLALIFILVNQSLLYNRLSEDVNSEKRTFRVVKKSPLILTLFLISVCFVFIASLMLGVVCFQRLTLTFKNSQYKLDPRFVKFVNISIVLGSILGFSSLIPVIMGEYRIALWIIAPSCIGYPFFFLGIVYRFMSTTRTIARKMVQNHHGRQSIDESAMQRSRDLLNASLRLTVSTVIATLSSMIVMIIFFLRGTTDWKSRLPVLSQAVDCFINIYAMVCTFSQTEKYYHMILGGFHQWLLAKLLDSH